MSPYTFAVYLPTGPHMNLAGITRHQALATAIPLGTVTSARKLAREVRCKSRYLAAQAPLGTSL